MFICFGAGCFILLGLCVCACVCARGGCVIQLLSSRASQNHGKVRHRTAFPAARLPPPCRSHPPALHVSQHVVSRRGGAGPELGGDWSGGAELKAASRDWERLASKNGVGVETCFG